MQQQKQMPDIVSPVRSSFQDSPYWQDSEAVRGMFSDESEHKLTLVDLALKSAKQRGTNLSNASTKLSVFVNTSSRWRWRGATASGLIEGIAWCGL